MRWRVVVRTVLIMQRLSFLKLPHPDVVLQLLLLHVVLELLVEAVQSVDEFVLTGMHGDPALGTVMSRMAVLRAAHELILLVGVAVVVVLTTNRVIVRVDLDVLEALTAQRELMMLAHARRTLEREVRWSRRLDLVMEVVVEPAVVHVIDAVVSHRRAAHVTIVR